MLLDICIIVSDCGGILTGGVIRSRHYSTVPLFTVHHRDVGNLDVVECL